MRALRVAWILALGLLIGGGFYFLLIDVTDLPEAYGMVGVGGLCALAFLLAREQGFSEAGIDPRWLLSTWRVLSRIPPDIGLLCWEAVLQLIAPRSRRGTFRATRFRATADNPRDSGRRAISEWLGTISPNTIVIGVDPEAGLVLVHQLRRQGGSDQLDPLGLG